MLNNIEPRAVSAYGVQATNTFSIKANGKAFKVLIDGLYSDKIRAVIRELWTNALDSHVMAGMAGVPFDCHLPTRFEPTFSVRDYGVSLTDDGVMRLYTTVFESTKEDTNTQVGKLGLGSKSPFAYTDTFTVTAWLDGRKRTYSAFIGANYVPQIARMSDEPSDEPQGLEIAFPVKDDDVYAFVEKAKTVSRGFDVHPKHTGNVIVVEEPLILLSGAGWKLYDTSGFPDFSLGAQARQGCVLYPLDADAVAGLSEAESSLLEMALVIDFEIGQLEISASRESLGYDAPTQANIRARVAGIAREVTKHLEGQLGAAKTPWEFMLAKQLLKQQHLPNAFKQLVDRAKFRGRPASTSLMVYSKYLPGCAVYKVDRSKALRGSLTKSLTEDGLEKRFSVYPGDTVVYIQDPTVPTPYARARMVTHYTQNTQVYPRPNHVFYVRCVPGSRAFKRLFVAMGRPPMSVFVNLSTLPKPLPNVRADGTAAAKLKEIYNAYRLVDVDASVTDGGYYVPMAHRNFLDLRGGKKITSSKNVDSVTHSCVWYTIAALKKSGAIPDDAKVYGVPMSLKSVVADPGWVSLWDVAEKALHGFNEDAAKEYAANARVVADTFTTALVVARKIAASEVQEITDKTSPASILAAFVNECARVTAENTEMANMRLLVRALYNQLHPTVEAFADATYPPAVQDMIAAFAKTYPMVQLIPHPEAALTPDAALRTVVEYINYIDAAKNNERI